MMIPPESCLDFLLFLRVKNYDSTEFYLLQRIVETGAGRMPVDSNKAIKSFFCSFIVSIVFVSK